jgi:hypothetical protein
MLNLSVTGKKICEIMNRLHQKRHGLEHLQEFANFTWQILCFANF